MKIIYEIGDQVSTNGSVGTVVNLPCSDILDLYNVQIDGGDIVTVFCNEIEPVRRGSFAQE